MQNNGFFILKTSGAYVYSGPRRNKQEGVCTTEHKPDALRFETKEAANDWVRSLREKQRGWGFKSFELARAVPVFVSMGV